MTPKDQEFKMVPLNGLEPLLPCGNQILSPFESSSSIYNPWYHWLISYHKEESDRCPS